MPNFSEAEWEEIVANAYAKYSGLKAWHDAIVKQVRRHGFLRTPTGRLLRFSRYPSKYGPDYREPQIKNYPVQSLAMDVVTVALNHLFKKKEEEGWKSRMVNQIHDAILWDCPKEEVDYVAQETIKAFRDVPRLMKEAFGIDWNVPMDGDCKIGPNWLQMEEYSEGEIT